MPRTVVLHVICRAGCGVATGTGGSRAGTGGAWDAVVLLPTFIWHGIGLICVTCTAVVCVWGHSIAWRGPLAPILLAGFGSPAGSGGPLAGSVGAWDAVVLLPAFI